MINSDNMLINLETYNIHACYEQMILIQATDSVIRLDKVTLTTVIDVNNYFLIVGRQSKLGKLNIPSVF